MDQRCVYQSITIKNQTQNFVSILEVCLASAPSCCVPLALYLFIAMLIREGKGLLNLINVVHLWHLPASVMVDAKGLYILGGV